MHVHSSISWEVVLTISFKLSLYLYPIQLAPAAAELMGSLQSILGDKNVSSAMAVREQHGRDESYHQCHPADLVVFPANKEEVSEVAKLCYANDVPMVPYGTGTGLEGGIVALKVTTTK